ncbi:hypothetical protein T440DRAFT_412903, partial [Plenodomus tracheiphilus IPT5]
MVPPAAHTTNLEPGFLASCIYKSKPARDVWEPLGLFSSVNDARKDPEFAKEGANELYKKIKRIAKDYSKSYANGMERLQADLAKDTTFSNDVQELARQYGTVIWGRPSDSQERNDTGLDAALELTWDEESDRKRIMFYIRCWIVRLTMKVFSTTPRKPPKKSLVRPLEVIEDDHNASDSSGPSDLHLVPVARMLPPSTCGTVQPTVESWRESAATHTGSRSNANINTSLDAPRTTPAKCYDQTTPSKRKAIDIDEGASNGKLPKTCKTARSTQVPVRRQDRDPYSIPRSPTAVANRVAESFVQQRIRESSYNTDRTWRPRDETAETETIADVGEVRDIELDSFMQSTILDAERDRLFERNEQDYCIAGPSGTYRNPFRQDSVNPGDAQMDIQRATTECVESGPIIRHTANKTTVDDVQDPRLLDRPGIEATQEEMRRIELFKLLLSHLNNINQFSAETYSMEAEQRMNMLLHQFRINDTELLQAKLGVDFARLQVALESWMGMRHRLSEFRVVTGYLGQPGEQWEEHLRHMPNVPCAYASLSYVELQESAAKDRESSYVVDSFDEDLAKMFDVMTMVKGCNGSEAFKGIGVYNAVLLEWFK